MTVRPVLSPEQLASKAEQMQTLAELIQAYPAEAQLIIAAVEDGLTLGPARIAQHACPIVIRMDTSGSLHAPGGEGSERREPGRTDPKKRSWPRCELRDQEHGDRF